MAASAYFCRCGALIMSTGRVGRPRLYCHTCKPPGARRAKPLILDDPACFGAPVSEADLAALGVVLAAGGPTP